MPLIDYLQSLDTEAFLTLNGVDHTQFLNEFMFTATGRYMWIPFYVALFIALLGRFGWRRTLLWTVAIALTLAAADSLCAMVIKPWVARLRPSNPDNPLSAMAALVDGYRAGRYGFPSNHAANSFALALISSLAMRRKFFTLTIFAWACLNTYTRVYLGVHYPGDLLCGALIGMLIAWFVWWIVREVLDHVPQHAPAWARHFPAQGIPALVLLLEIGALALYAY